MAKKEGTSRRGFFWKLWWGLGGLMFIEYLWLVFDFLKPGRSLGADAETNLVLAGPVDRFIPGTVTAFPEGKFYLARLDDGGFLALSRTCTHLGCTVPWVEEEGKFVCPCHASSFGITGDVLSSPASRALDLFPVRIENDQVKVDISRPRKRRGFEPAQAVRA
jgi:cytochrome b6-f complex iron-sulfur subunit